MSKIINGVASEYDFPFKDFNVNYDEEGLQKFNRWQDPTIEEYKKEIERLNNIINELERHIKTLVYQDIYGEQIIDSILNKLKELKGEQNEKEIKTETVV